MYFIFMCVYKCSCSRSAIYVLRISVSLNYWTEFLNQLPVGWFIWRTSSQSKTLVWLSSNVLFLLLLSLSHPYFSFLEPSCQSVIDVNANNISDFISMFTYGNEPLDQVILVLNIALLDFKWIRRCKCTFWANPLTTPSHVVFL